MAGINPIKQLIQSIGWAILEFAIFQQVSQQLQVTMG
jgi:hypothetical protein